MNIETFQSLRFIGLTILFLISLSTNGLAEDKKTEPVKEKNNIEEIIDAMGEEETDTSVTYSPDFCDFEITFPEKPMTTQRCPEGVGKCYTLTSYTMVYDLTTTVEIGVSCVPSTPAQFSRYSEPVIRAALNGMVARAGISEFSIKTDETEDTRQGSLVGTGPHGRSQKIYNAQLWVGQNSVFTVESKLIGGENSKADSAFSAILKSIKKK